MTKYVFVTGGVSSSLGKGLACASLAALLIARGLKVATRKLDPYLNVDPGTMNPTQHGEVFVTDDGAETDLDLGHYERFTNQSCTRYDSISSGKIYLNVITKERAGDYLGQTVQMIPHITDNIKQFMYQESAHKDVVICEVGGTVGDIEGLPFFEAIRQMRYELGKKNHVLIHVTFLPYIKAAGEIKTKPSQHSVHALQGLGLQPDVLLCRSSYEINDEICQKLANFCNVKVENVIKGNDAENIYEIPLIYHQEGLDKAVCNALDINSSPDLTAWQRLNRQIQSAKNVLNIGVVGKYMGLQDAYKSVNQAIMHAATENLVKANIIWLDAEEESLESELLKLDALIVPGGFGSRGVEGKLKAISHARLNKLPFLGICLGMQLTVIEAIRNVLGLKSASSTEFGPTDTPAVALIQEWANSEEKKLYNVEDTMGGTLRLGAHLCRLAKGSLAEKIYGGSEIHERHRHRYEVNVHYKDDLEKHGYWISGMSENGLLPEIIEYKDHPYFIAAQYHPEFKSRPFQPHPLFVKLIEAASKRKK